LEITVNVTIEEMPARIVGGPTIEGYAVICDRAIREWVRSRDEATRIAEQIRRDSTNPEDY
tara:strand:- start:673 stop:855 length:183 start_codon:yes stop_codon:yes gene_type:complete